MREKSVIVNPLLLEFNSDRVIHKGIGYNRVMKKEYILYIAVGAFLLLTLGGYVFRYRFYIRDAVTLPAGKVEELAIVAKWQNIEDPKFTREFLSDGSVVDRYEGDESATQTGIWAPSGMGEIPFSVPVDETKKDFTLTFGNEKYFFRVMEITRTKLVLMYLDRGNFLEFKKIK